MTQMAYFLWISGAAVAPFVVVRNVHSQARYPRVRHATRELLQAAARKHIIHAIVELDLTDARRRSEGLSFRPPVRRIPTYRREQSVEIGRPGSGA